MSTHYSTLSASEFAPDVYVYDPTDYFPEALLFRATTLVTTELEGDHPVATLPWVADATAHITKEGEEIQDADPEINSVTLGTVKVANVLTLSNELRQQANKNAPDVFDQAMRAAVINKVNEMFLTQPEPEQGAITPPAGIVHSASKIESPVIQNNFDPLATAIAYTEEAGGRPDLIICSPSTWAHLQTIKTGEGSAAPLLGVGTEAPVRRLMGLEVRTSRFAPQGKLFVIDPRAIAAAASGVKQAISDHSGFKKDSVEARVTWRVGWTVKHPDRLWSVDVNMTPGE